MFWRTENLLIILPVFIVALSNVRFYSPYGLLKFSLFLKCWSYIRKVLMFWSLEFFKDCAKTVQKLRNALKLFKKLFKKLFRKALSSEIWKCWHFYEMCWKLFRTFVDIFVQLVQHIKINYQHFQQIYDITVSRWAYAHWLRIPCSSNTKFNEFHSSSYKFDGNCNLRSAIIKTSIRANKVWNVLGAVSTRRLGNVRSHIKFRPSKSMWEQIENPLI